MANTNDTHHTPLVVSLATAGSLCRNFEPRRWYPGLIDGLKALDHLALDRLCSLNSQSCSILYFPNALESKLEVTSVPFLEELQDFFETVDRAADTIPELCASQQHSCRYHCGEQAMFIAENSVISFSI
ncbi:hypothetical protein PoB_001743900 [Plakobranchus ocellatus]|uniref:Uncharacterized protein n=1 Tax=Plakobranchus ocellatus TaxID=259542 RepID=A0AAV3Z934_9GAST|nr:hypothetical protein PoB_001743900 [Plakobranchus ocellatus]